MIDLVVHAFREQPAAGVDADVRHILRLAVVQIRPVPVRNDFEVGVAGIDLARLDLERFRARTAVIADTRDDDLRRIVVGRGVDVVLKREHVVHALVKHSAAVIVRPAARVEQRREGKRLAAVIEREGIGVVHTRLIAHLGDVARRDRDRHARIQIFFVRRFRVVEPEYVRSDAETGEHLRTEPDLRAPLLVVAVVLQFRIPVPDGIERIAVVRPVETDRLVVRDAAFDLIEREFRHFSLQFDLRFGFAEAYREFLAFRIVVFFAVRVVDGDIRRQFFACFAHGRCFAVADVPAVFAVPVDVEVLVLVFVQVGNGVAVFVDQDDFYSAGLTKRDVHLLVFLQKLYVTGYGGVILHALDHQRVRRRDRVVNGPAGDDRNGRLQRVPVFVPPFYRAFIRNVFAQITRYIKNGRRSLRRCERDILFAVCKADNNGIFFRVCRARLGITAGHCYIAVKRCADGDFRRSNALSYVIHIVSAARGSERIHRAHGVPRYSVARAACIRYRVSADGRRDDCNGAVLFKRDIHGLFRLSEGDLARRIIIILLTVDFKRRTRRYSVCKRRAGRYGYGLVYSVTIAVTPHDLTVVRYIRTLITGNG